MGGGLQFNQRQADVGIAFAGAAHCAKPVDDGRLEPYQALPLRIQLRLESNRSERKRGGDGVERQHNAAGYIYSHRTVEAAQILTLPLLDAGRSRASLFCIYASDCSSPLVVTALCPAQEKRTIPQTPVQFRNSGSAGDSSSIQFQEEEACP